MALASLKLKISGFPGSSLFVAKPQNGIDTDKGKKLIKF
jgi:hypothetical protein